jgi:hypothetical protein
MVDSFGQRLALVELPPRQLARAVQICDPIAYLYNLSSEILVLSGGYESLHTSAGDLISWRHLGRIPS